MDAESKRQAMLDVLLAGRAVVDAYRLERRGLYRTYGMDKLVKMLDALDDAVMLYEATIPLKAPPEQTKLNLQEEER